MKAEHRSWRWQQFREVRVCKIDVHVINYACCRFLAVRGECANRYASQLSDFFFSVSEMVCVLTSTEKTLFRAFIRISSTWPGANCPWFEVFRQVLPIQWVDIVDSRCWYFSDSVWPLAICLFRRLTMLSDVLLSLRTLVWHQGKIAVLAHIFSGRVIRWFNRDHDGAEAVTHVGSITKGLFRTLMLGVVWVPHCRGLRLPLFSSLIAEIAQNRIKNTESSKLKLLFTIISSYFPFYS